MRLTKNVLRCDCEESCFEGLPCRHELCVFVKDTLPNKNLNIHERWKKTYFDEEMLPKISSDAEEEEELEEEKENVENSSRSDNTEEENILDDESFSEGNEVQDVLSAFSTDDDVNDNKVFFSPYLY